jgi:hypothetical protein
MILSRCLIVVSVAAAGIPVLAQDAPLNEHVSLTISTEREAYFQAEVVRVRLTMKNTSDTRVEGFFQLDPREGQAEVYHRPPGGTFGRLDLEFSRGDTMVERAGLNPGEVRLFEVRLSLTSPKRGEGEFVLDDVGTHEFRVIYRDAPDDPTSVIKSNVISVQVVAPPPEEQEAYSSYTPDLGYVAVFQWGQSYLTPEETKAAADFIQRFPNSRYTPLVRTGLAASVDYRVRRNVATEEERLLYERLVEPPRPPKISVSVALWPPDGRLVPVTIAVNASDDAGASTPVELLSVGCDDNCDGANDIVGAMSNTDDRQFELRATRSDPKKGRTYWVTYRTADRRGTTATATASVVVPPDIGSSAAVRPVLECVADEGGGRYRAYFGYVNGNAQRVRLFYGLDNNFRPEPAKRGQPVVFKPGRTPPFPRAAFSVPFDGKDLVWTLSGLSVTASKDSRRCE